MVLAAALTSPAIAQDSPVREPLTVGLFVSPPFVMQVDGKYKGMAVDVWEDLSTQLAIQSDYVHFANFREMMDATALGNIDVAVTNVTITRARAERFDFTQPWFDAGLRIMVNEDRGTGLRAVVLGLADAGYLRAYGWLAFVIVVATMLLTLFDRRFNEAFPSRWRDGVAESFYTVMSVATSGRMPGRPNLFGWIGRIMQAIWLVCGIAVLAYVTSSVTSVMTTLALTREINYIGDLPGKLVGVQDGSTAEKVATDEGFTYRVYEDTQALADALLNQEIDAIIGDAPVLEYFARSNPDLPFDVVGPIFEPDKYGFALPRGSEFTLPLTVELLGAREEDRIEEIRARYFGDDP